MDENESVADDNTKAAAPDDITTPSEAKSENEKPSEFVVGYTLEEVDQMQNELEESRTKAQENLDGWQRAQADYSNLKRRVEREQIQMRQNAVVDVVEPFLDVLDDIELALKNPPQGDEAEAWAAGIELVYRKLLSRLETQGLQVMDVGEQEFDPTYHEAITHEDSNEHESGQIIEFVKPGYLIGERVLRPAMVRVAA